VKKLVFHLLLWTPLLLIAAALFHLAFRTNLPQLVYMDSIRNMPFGCLDLVSDAYVYKMKPGPCALENIEYDTVLTHDAEGFRVSRPEPHYDVAVIGDSHAHGVGVADDQTFAHLLSSEHHRRARNLAIGSYATRRELDVLGEYGRDADYVVLQYCENDANENHATLKLGDEALRAQIEASLKDIMADYEQGKALGYRKPLQDLARKLLHHDYTSKVQWRTDLNTRNIEQEAHDFAKILDRYRPLLEGKRLIILESSGWLSNSPRFKTRFSTELGYLGWPQSRVLDSTKILADGDSFVLDDHLNASGHRKLAAVIDAEIAAWERADPILDSRPPK
jgi:hypothetical protein